MYAHNSVSQEALIKSRITELLKISDVKIHNIKIDGRIATFTFPTPRDCEIFERCLRNYSSFKLATQTVAPVSQTIALRYDDAFKSALGLLSYSSISLSDIKDSTNTTTTFFDTKHSHSQERKQADSSSALTFDKAKELQQIGRRLVEQSERGAIIQAIACYQRALPTFIVEYGPTHEETLNLQTQLDDAQQLLAALQLSEAPSESSSMTTKSSSPRSTTSTTLFSPPKESASITTGPIDTKGSITQGILGINPVLVTGSLKAHGDIRQVGMDTRAPLTAEFKEMMTKDVPLLSKIFSEQMLSSLEDNIRQSVDPVQADLKKHYCRQDKLPGLLNEHTYPMVDVNLSITEYQSLTNVLPRAEENKETNTLANYERFHNSRHPIPVDDIFDKTLGADGKLETKPAKRLLIFGAAGVGKTTMSLYLSYKWAMSSLWSTKFDYVFRLPLRQLLMIESESTTGTPSISTGDITTSGGNLTQIIVSAPRLSDEQLVAAFIKETCFNSKISIDAIVYILQNCSSRVLLIADGFDEVSHLYDNRRHPQIIRILSYILRAEYLILTSRPHQLSHLTSQFDRQLENIGFTDQNIADYTRQYFASVEPSSPKLAETLLDFLRKHPSIWGTAHIPVNLALICDLYLTKKRQPKELFTEQRDTITFFETVFNTTSLYQEMTLFLLRRYLSERRGINTYDCGDSYVYEKCKLELEFLGRLAFEGLKPPYNIDLSLDSQRSILDKMQEKYKDELERRTREETASSRISTPLFHAILKAGFLRASATETRGDVFKKHYFIHLTFQEFLAAHHLVTCLQQPDSLACDKAIKFITTNKYNRHYLLLLRFTAGLLSNEIKKDTLKETTKQAIKSFWESLEKEPRDLTEATHLFLIVNCLEEACCDPNIPQQSKYIQRINAYLTKVNMQNSLTPPGTFDGVIWDRIMAPLYHQTPYVISKLNFIKALLENLRGDEPSLRYQAASALSVLGLVVATEPILIACANILIQNLGSDNETSIKIIGAIRRMGLSAMTPVIRKALINTLTNNPSDLIKTNAALALQNAGEAKEQVVKTLHILENSNDDLSRLLASEALNSKERIKEAKNHFISNQDILARSGLDRAFDQLLANSEADDNLSITIKEDIFLICIDLLVSAHYDFPLKIAVAECLEKVSERMTTQRVLQALAIHLMNNYLITVCKGLSLKLAIQCYINDDSHEPEYASVIARIALLQATAVVINGDKVVEPRGIEHYSLSSAKQRSLKKAFIQQAQLCKLLEPAVVTEHPETEEKDLLCNGNESLITTTQTASTTLRKDLVEETLLALTDNKLTSAISLNTPAHKRKIHDSANNDGNKVLWIQQKRGAPHNFPLKLVNSGELFATNEVKHSTNTTTTVFDTKHSRFKEKKQAASSSLTLDEAKELQQAGLRSVEQGEKGTIIQAITCYQRALPIFIDKYGEGHEETRILQVQLNDARELLQALQLSEEGLGCSLNK